jgi:dTDP-4-amino-4,6-dideoxygalactose transaminase
MKISFSPPYIDKDIEDSVLESLRSGWITTGPKVRDLEFGIEKYANTKAAVAVNSWTSAAIMMLKWYGIGPGDEVIVPAYTYSATALAVLHVGAIPVMVDAKEDFTIDSELIAEFITPLTKAIIPVDIGGWPADYSSIYKLVEIKKSVFIPKTKEQEMLGRILILADAAHSFGATYNDIKIGTNADLVIFSLHAVKNLTTAEGGVICLNLPEPFDNLELKKFLKMYALNGQSKDAFSKSIPGSWKYDIAVQGFKFNMPDVCAAIGLAQLNKYDTLLNERKRVFSAYHDYFAQTKWAIAPPSELIYIDSNNESCYHLYLLRIRNISEDERDLMIQKISKTGVAVNVHFIPMPMLTLFKNLGYKIENYPVAYKNYACEISLPIYPQLNQEEIDFICNSITNAYHAVIKNSSTNL